MIGEYQADETGCEVIALNNAMYLLGHETSMAELVLAFQSNNLVIGGGLYKGRYGSNPYALPKIFDMYDMKYQTVLFSDLSVRGLYIVSYWIDNDYRNGVHTIVVESDGNGNYTLYNDSGKGKTESVTSLNFKMSYISGYRLE